MIKRKAQLFIIEVIIALSVLIILVSALFASQNLSPPRQDTDLQERGELAIRTMVENGILDTYLRNANLSYYIDGKILVESGNRNKTDVKNTILSSIPTIASYKAFTTRYNKVTGVWDQIDVVNYATSTPSSSDIVIIEYYSPGFLGIEDQFRFRLTLWYEVNL